MDFRKQAKYGTLMPMRVRARTSKLVPVVVVLVALLFFFPGSQGSFQTTNGPTSTLKECAIGLLLQSLILLLARIILGLFDLLRGDNSIVFSIAAVSPPASCPCLAPLRC